MGRTSYGASAGAITSALRSAYASAITRRRLSPAHRLLWLPPADQVSYYSSGCYNCSSGGSKAGAAAAGLIVGAAVGARSPRQTRRRPPRTPTTRASPPAARTPPRRRRMPTTRESRRVSAPPPCRWRPIPWAPCMRSPPAGSITTVIQGQTYYLNGNTLVPASLWGEWGLLPRGARAVGTFA